MPAERGNVDAIAVDEDGKFITAQVCSCPGWAITDMTGENSSKFHGWFYNQRYPEGYTLRWSEDPHYMWGGQKQHTDETVAPWHRDPANNSTLYQEV